MNKATLNNSNRTIGGVNKLNSMKFHCLKYTIMYIFVRISIRYESWNSVGIILPEKLS